MTQHLREFQEISEAHVAAARIAGKLVKSSSNNTSTLQIIVNIHFEDFLPDAPSNRRICDALASVIEDKYIELLRETVIELGRQRSDARRLAKRQFKDIFGEDP